MGSGTDGAYLGAGWITRQTTPVLFHLAPVAISKYDTFVLIGFTNFFNEKFSKKKCNATLQRGTHIFFL